MSAAVVSSTGSADVADRSTASQPARDYADARSATVFAALCVGAIVSAAALAGLAPIGLSIFAVFLFAGPHNWMEFRYFLSRMPSRWGSRTRFYRTALVGCLALSLAFVGIAVAGRTLPLTAASGGMISSLWMTGLIAWLATLGTMRVRERNGDPTWIVGLAFVGVGFAWLFPGYGELALVFLHPCVALFFFDRLLRRHRPEWRPLWRGAMALVPLTILGFALIAFWSPPLQGTDALTARLTSQVGAGYLPFVSPRFLVSTHAFLELLHYGVWILAAPLLVRGQVPWNVDLTPLAKSARSWKWALRVIVYGGAIAAVGLWLCFFANYGLTRDVYFTVAIVHVLAEFAFLTATK